MIVKLLATLCGLIATFGCGDPPLPADSLRPAAALSQQPDFVAIAPAHLSRLNQMTATERRSMFVALSKGDTTTLQQKFPNVGVMFFEAVRKAEGYHGSAYPSADRLEALLQSWAQAPGNEQEKLLGLYGVWKKPLVAGFGLRWVKDLPPKTVNGRALEGWVVRNSGTVRWPTTLRMEPLATLETKDVTLPKAVVIQPRDPGETFEVWVDVADTKMRGDLYFLTTFENKDGVRCYILPRPELILGGKPNASFVTFK